MGDWNFNSYRQGYRKEVFKYFDIHFYDIQCEEQCRTHDKGPLELTVLKRKIKIKYQGVNQSQNDDFEWEWTRKYHEWEGLKELIESVENEGIPIEDHYMIVDDILPHTWYYKFEDKLKSLSWAKEKDWNWKTVLTADEQKNFNKNFNEPYRAGDFRCPDDVFLSAQDLKQLFDVLAALKQKLASAKDTSLHDTSLELLEGLEADSKILFGDTSGVLHDEFKKKKKKKRSSGREGGDDDEYVDDGSEGPEYRYQIGRYYWTRNEIRAAAEIGLFRFDGIFHQGFDLEWRYRYLRALARKKHNDRLQCQKDMESGCRDDDFAR